MNEEEEQLQGPVLIQGSLRAALRSSRQTSSLDIVLMATAQQGVIDPETAQDDTALTCLRDLLTEQNKAQRARVASPPNE